MCRKTAFEKLFIFYVSSTNICNKKYVFIKNKTHFFSQKSCKKIIALFYAHISLEK